MAQGIDLALEAADPHLEHGDLGAQIAVRLQRLDRLLQPSDPRD